MNDMEEWESSKWGALPPEYWQKQMERKMKKKRGGGNGAIVAALILSICSVGIFMYAFFLTSIGSISAAADALFVSFLLQGAVVFMLIIAVARGK